MQVFSGKIPEIIYFTRLNRLRSVYSLFTCFGPDLVKELLNRICEQNPALNLDQKSSILVDSRKLPSLDSLTIYIDNLSINGLMIPCIDHLDGKQLNTVGQTQNFTTY